MAPIPPRGNYQNVHDFLNAYHEQQTQPSEESVNYNLKANTLPRTVDSVPKESPPSRSSTMRLYDYMGKKKVYHSYISFSLQTWAGYLTVIHKDKLGKFKDFSGTQIFREVNFSAFISNFANSK